MTPLYLILWPLNGLLVLLYGAVENAAVLVLTVSAALFAFFAPPEQRGWAFSTSTLAVFAAFISPSPVPLFLMAISLSGWAGMLVEKYNRLAVRWNVVRGQALYALAGIGYALYRALGLDAGLVSDPSLTQGATYLNGLLGIAMYVIPIGFLAYQAQGLFAHPPAPDTPEQLIRTVRTRGKG